MRSAILFSSTALASVFVSAPALAQDEGRDSGAARDQNVIIVTAQKREQNLQEVTAAVSAFSEERLAVAGIESAQNLDLVTPGLTMTESVFIPQPVLRGISTRNRNPGDEASIPTYIDGVYQPWAAGSFFEYNNIERIEVLRGPQGTLFGRNAIGGAMNIVTRRPSYDATGDFSLSYGSFDKVKATGYVSSGLGDTAAFDIGAYLINGGGYYKDIVSGKTWGDHDNTWSVRSKLLFEPTDRTEITLAYTYVDYDNPIGFVGQPFEGNVANAAAIDATGGLAKEPYEAALTFAEVKQKQHSVALTVRQDFDGFYVESLTGYQKTKVDGRADIDLTAPDVLEFGTAMRSESVTQALNLISDNDSNFQWIAGLFYMNAKSGYSPYKIRTPGGTTLLYTNVDTDAYAAFAEGTLEFGAGFSLTTGLRYSYETKAFQGSLFTTLVSDVSDSWSDLSPRIVLGWQVNPDINAYISYSEAFKSGVYNTGSLRPVAVDPEKLRAFEAGLKMDLTDTLRVNLASYYYRHKDLQVTSRLEGDTSTSLLLNAAKVESYGLEGEIAFNPTPDLRLNGGFSYLHAKYKDFPGGVISTPIAGGGNVISRADNLAGFDVEKAPDWSFSVGGSYQAELFGGLATFGGTIAWTDAYPYEPDGRVVNPAHWDASALISWTPENGGYKISVYGSNLFDEEYLTSAITSGGADNARYAAPRTFGARLDFSF